MDTLKPGLVFYGGDDRIKPDTLKKVSDGDQIKVSFQYFIFANIDVSQPLGDFVKSANFNLSG